MKLEGLSLTYGPGKLDGNLVMDESQVRFAASFQALPLALAEALDLGLDADGQLSGKAELTGPLAAPEGKLDLQVQDFILNDGSDTPLPKLTAEAKIALASGRLSLDGQISGFADRAVMVQAVIPARLSLEPFEFEASQNAPLSGSLQFQGSAETLSQLFIDPQERLKGDVYADLTLKGTISDPALSGGLGLRAATYENLVTGTTLKDLELAVIAEGSNLKIDKMTARTSKGGKVKGSGSINIDPDENFPIDLQVSLSKAMLIQRDDVKAAFDGDIALKGTLAKLLLKGKFETTTAELRFIDNLPPEVVTIDVVEKNLPPSEQKRQREPSSSPIQVDLDLKLSMPDRVFLRSQEIDTEWGGDFTITGTTDKPIIEGTLRPVRGHVSLLGNRFALQQGSISLDGSDELDPLLDLTAVHQKTDLTAMVQVQGRLSDPEITLTSTPPLPEDEIISRVLFDKSANTLTAAEALELATVVANMARGDPSDGGVLGGVRGALGLDVLSVGASEEGSGAAVSAGRYLADGVYVGVDQGTETDSTRAKVEVDLTPNITLESDVGADNTGSVGVKWQWDY
jgi:autotransporter translocation and assembly factor TamB